MAVVKNLVTTTLQLEVQKGVNANGDPVLGKVSFRNVKGGAAVQDIYDVALTLADLQQLPLDGVNLVEENHLIDQG